jgi:hypothetical protein
VEPNFRTAVEGYKGREEEEKTDRKKGKQGERGKL